MVISQQLGSHNVEGIKIQGSLQNDSKITLARLTQFEGSGYYWALIVDSQANLRCFDDIIE
jgi:hypothetical protein